MAARESSPLRSVKRREFLIRCCQGTSAALIPADFALYSQTAALADSEFHLHPRYREQTALDAILLKTKAGSDDFLSEKYHDQIAAILGEWSADLLESPGKIRAIEKVLAPGFAGPSLRPIMSKLVRTGTALTVHRITFGQQPSLAVGAFLEELRAGLKLFSKILTAELQVTRIDPGSGGLTTRVRYELVGTGTGFYREQRTGYWELEWETASSGRYRLRRWQTSEEVRSRSSTAFYADIAAGVFSGNSSYSTQLIPGVDYWRTVVDGACEIDIYGHNGVSVGDIDGDGFDDLYVCQPAGLPNRLFRNRGDGTFEDITDASGAGILENTACALFADFDNDGRQDLVVVRSNGPQLLLNQGGGKFRRKVDAFQFANAPQGTFTGAAAADYDRDGWLDIYFCLYVYYQGTDQYKYPVPYYAAENGPPNFLMRNNGDGTFRDVTAESGLNQNNTRYSFCCAWGDYNRDGWPDLYVANDFGRKNLYRNNGDGTFTDLATQAGIEDVGAGMSVCWFDYDNDGLEDLYVADMWTAAGERISRQVTFQKDAPKEVQALYRKHAMGNSLFHNSGDGSFADASASAGVGIGRWSWSSDAWDFDHDGHADIYIANGMLSGPLREDLNSFFWRQVVANAPFAPKPLQDYEQGWNAVNELIRSDYTWSGFERNVFYANNRDGTFSDVSGAVGLDFIEDGRAFALADFDHDGRQEVFLKNRNGPQLRLLKNVVAGLPPSIAFRLRGIKSNRDAVGAAVTLETNLGRQIRLLQIGSGFLSQHSKEVFFGLADAKGPIRATIVWPSGLVQELSGLLPNHRVWVEEGAEPSRMEPFHENGSPVISKPQHDEPLPSIVETWLLAPVAAPKVPLLEGLRGELALVTFSRGAVVSNDHPTGVRLLAVDADDPQFDDVIAVFNILYRYLFDRHRDLALPTSFLIDGNGDIVKIYQGPVKLEVIEKDSRHIPGTRAEQMAKGLPFPGAGDSYEFGRNYLTFGSVFFQRGYFDQAQASFRLAFRDDPSSAEACYGLGSAYLKQEKNREARDAFEQALKLKASYPDTVPNAWNNLGILATREGRMDEAVRSFQEALRVSPGYFIALENLGNAYRQQKRWDEARKTLEAALAIRPQDPEANYSLGMVFAQSEDTARAYEYLDRAVQLRPGYPEALNNLGVLYLRTGRRNEAVRSFEECIRASPGFDQSYLNLARVYALDGEPAKARATLIDLLKRHPGHAQAQRALEQIK